MKALATQTSCNIILQKNRGLSEQESPWDNPLSLPKLTTESLIIQFLHASTSTRVNPWAYKHNDDFSPSVLMFWDFASQPSFATAQWNQAISADYFLLWGKRSGLVLSVLLLKSQARPGPFGDSQGHVRTLHLQHNTAALLCDTRACVTNKTLSVLNKSWDKGLY